MRKSKYKRLKRSIKHRSKKIKKEIKTLKKDFRKLSKKDKIKVGTMVSTLGPLSMLAPLPGVAPAFTLSTGAYIKRLSKKNKKNKKKNKRSKRSKRK